jgi:hypothetical protein
MFNNLTVHNLGPVIFGGIKPLMIDNYFFVARDFMLNTHDLAPAESIDASSTGYNPPLKLCQIRGFV